MIAQNLLIWMLLTSALTADTASVANDIGAAGPQNRPMPAKTAEYRLPPRDPSAISLAPIHF